MQIDCIRVGQSVGKSWLVMIRSLQTKIKAKFSVAFVFSGASRVKGVFAKAKIALVHPSPIIVHVDWSLESGVRLASL